MSNTHYTNISNTQYTIYIIHNTQYTNTNISKSWLTSFYTFPCRVLNEGQVRSCVSFKTSRYGHAMYRYSVSYSVWYRYRMGIPDVQPEIGYIEANGCEVWSPIANLGCPKSQTSKHTYSQTLLYIEVRCPANGCGHRSQTWMPEIANFSTRSFWS